MGGAKKRQQEARRGSQPVSGRRRTDGGRRAAQYYYYLWAKLNYPAQRRQTTAKASQQNHQQKKKMVGIASSSSAAALLLSSEDIQSGLLGHGNRPFLANVNITLPEQSVASLSSAHPDLWAAFSSGNHEQCLALYDSGRGLSTQVVSPRSPSSSSSLANYYACRSKRQCMPCWLTPSARSTSAAAGQIQTTGGSMKA